MHDKLPTQLPSYVYKSTPTQYVSNGAQHVAVVKLPV